jgi:diguanylate cyclase (GGDEF)-like protein
MKLGLPIWKDRTGGRSPVDETEEYDSLTQVASYRCALRRLGDEVGRAIWFNQPLSCLILDLDGFAAVNEAIGQAGGDQILREIAAFLSRSVRSTDVVARHGADRFLIIAPRVNAQGAQAMATRLLTKLRRRRFRVAGSASVRLTATIGAASCGGGPASEPFDLLQRALDAVARGKSQGGDRMMSG